MSIKNQKRQEELLKLINTESFLDVKTMVKYLKISEATLRRDLSTLEKQGKIKRVPGGAIKVERETSLVTPQYEISVPGRLKVNSEIKKQVAKLASSYINDGDCVFIDGGSSMVYFADYLANRPVKIITNNILLIARTINKPTTAEIYTIGGNFYKKYAMNTGKLANQEVSQYYYDKALISCVGANIANNITTNAETDTVEVKSIAMKNAKENYLVLDSSKLEVNAFCKTAPLSDFDIVFCNKDSQFNIEFPDNFIFTK